MGSHYTGSKKEITILNSFIKLSRSVESINSQISSEISGWSVTLSQFNVLDALYHLGPLSQKALADKLLKSGGNITLVIDNLEKQKFVKRKKNKDDRRFVSISLTPKGESVIKEILPDVVSVIKKRMTSLSDEEHSVLQDICKRIGKNG